MNIFIKIEDPNFLRFLQTKKFNSALCDENGKKNKIGPFIDPKADSVLNKTEISIRNPDIYSQILNIKGIEVFVNLKNLSCKGIGLRELHELPLNLKTLNVGGNKLKKMPILPDLTFLDISSNENIELDNLPETLEHLNYSSCNLKKLPKLPSNLKELIIWKNPEIEIEQLPENLEILDCVDCELTSLPELPKSIKEIRCRNNKLKELPFLPDSLKMIDCSSNLLTEKPFHKTAYINIDYNKIKTIIRNGNESYFDGSQTNNYLLKLLIVNELLKRDKDIRYDLDVILDNLDWGLDKIGFGYFISIRKYVENLKVSKEQLESIKEISFSRDNEIYSILDPDMDDEIADYDVTSFDGIQELTNLTTVFHENGVDDDADWSPFLELINIKNFYSAEGELEDLLNK